MMKMSERLMKDLRDAAALPGVSHHDGGLVLGPRDARAVVHTVDALREEVVEHRIALFVSAALSALWCIRQKQWKESCDDCWGG